MKHCIYCGAEMPDEIKFCGNCGKPLDEEQNEQQQTVTLQKNQQINSSPSNVMGIIGFVLSILGLLWLLLTSFGVAYFFAIVGIIFSCIGIFKKENRLAIASGCIACPEIIFSVLGFTQPRGGAAFEGFSISFNFGDIVLQLSFMLPAIIFIVLMVMVQKRKKKNRTKME